MSDQQTVSIQRGTPEEESNWALDIPSEHRLRSENLSFDIDVWYPQVRHLTYKTIFSPFQRKEAKAIVAYYRTLHDIARPADFSSKDAHVLEELEQRLDHLIQTNFGGKGGAFLRLCGRSPKDGEPENPKRMLTKYHEELERLVEGGRERDVDTKMMAIYRVPVMRVGGGEEAMHMLLSSERVYSDLIDWLDYGEPEQVLFSSSFF